MFEKAGIWKCTATREGVKTVEDYDRIWSVIAYLI
jgi:hypothetical protein